MPSLIIRQRLLETSQRLPNQYYTFRRTFFGWLQSTENPILTALQHPNRLPKLDQFRVSHVKAAKEFIQSPNDEDTDSLLTTEGQLWRLQHLVRLQCEIQSDPTWKTILPNLAIDESHRSRVWEHLQASNNYPILPALQNKYAPPLVTDQRLSEALDSVVESIQNVSRPHSTRNLKEVYNYVGIRTAMSQERKFTHPVQELVPPSLVNDTHTLHAKILERLVPAMNKFRTTSSSSVVVHGLLSSTADQPLTDPPTTSLSVQALQDHRNSLRLEQYVHLDGAMAFLDRLATDLFGITMQVDNDDSQNTLWAPGVQVFRVYDQLNNDNYLGSFALDPFRRDGKSEGCFTIPIQYGTTHDDSTTALDPMVVVSLQIPPPVWDHDSVFLTWEDCESLLHEFGHVLQLLLADRQHGYLYGPHHLPYHLTEILPMFMERWLMERTTLYALISMSESNQPLSDESINALFRHRSNEKSLKLSDSIFRSRLELELFSGFDLKGDENVLDLQRRVAEECSYELPASTIEPLWSLISGNAAGLEVCCYRYLLGDVLGVQLFEKFRQETKAGNQILVRSTVREHLLEPGSLLNLKAVSDKLNLSTTDPTALLEAYHL